MHVPILFYFRCCHQSLYRANSQQSVRRLLSCSPIIMQIHERRTIEKTFLKRCRKWTKLEAFQNVRRRANNYIANQYHLERIMQMGPDFACLECILYIQNRQMRGFLMNHGLDIRQLGKEPPEAQLIKEFDSKQKDPSTATSSDVAYSEKWRHILPIHIKEIDASDAVITDRGFKYFTECRNIEKMKLHFCDYITDEAIATLARGRTARTLKELEIVVNGQITDASVFLLIKLKSLRRLHLYFLPLVTKRAAVLRQLKIGLPLCKVTFPEEFFVGYGYETEEEKVAYKKTREKGGFFTRFFG